MTEPEPELAPEARPSVRVVLDDDTVHRLQQASARLGLGLEQLMVELLAVASRRIDEFVIGEPACASEPRGRD